MNKWKWFLPGLRVKRWIAMIVLGVLIFSLGTTFIIGKNIPREFYLFVTSYIRQGVFGFSLAFIGIVFLVYGASQLRRRIVGLFMPDGETQPVQSRDGRLTVNTTDSPGIYRLKGDREELVARGFSVNLPAGDSHLERVTKEHFDELFGEDRFQLARDHEEIERVQGQQRTGREFFPLLMVVLAVTLILEQLLANRFYRDTDTSTS